MGGWETRDEEAQQLNIPQPVVNSEWGRKTMSPLILRAHSLSFHRQVQPQVSGERERERKEPIKTSLEALIKSNLKIKQAAVPPVNSLGAGLRARRF